MPTSDPIAALTKFLITPLKRHRFKREPSEAGFEIFGRKLDGGVERIGILPTTGGGRSGDFVFTVALGIEFTDLELERTWIGMPRTHGSVGLKLLNKAAPKEFVGTADTDLKRLATQLVELVVEASEELQRRSAKLRKAYVSLVEVRGSNAVKRLAIFAEREAKVLKKKAPEARKASGPSSRASLNVFEIAAALLKTKKDQVLDLELHDFDDASAHDRRLPQRIQQQFADQAQEIEAVLGNILGAPHETGTTEHRKLPINGVCRFAYWNVGWRLLYVAVSHEDIGLPCRLVMGTVGR